MNGRKPILKFETYYIPKRSHRNSLLGSHILDRIGKDVLEFAEGSICPCTQELKIVCERVYLPI